MPKVFDYHGKDYFFNSAEFTSSDKSQLEPIHIHVGNYKTKKSEAKYWLCDDHSVKLANGNSKKPYESSAENWFNIIKACWLAHFGKYGYTPELKHNKDKDYKTEGRMFRYRTSRILTEASVTLKPLSLMDLPNVMSGASSVKINTPADLTEEVFISICDTTGQIIYNLTAAEKLIYYFNAKKPDLAVGDQSLWNSAGKEINTQEVPKRVKLPLIRMMYGFAYIFKAYTSDSNLKSRIDNSMTSIADGLKSMYGAIPDLDVSASYDLETVLKDISAACSNLSILSDMLIARTGQFAEKAVSDDTIEINPLMTIADYSKWAMTVKGQCDNLIRTAAQIEDSAPSDAASTRRYKPGYKQVEYTPNKVAWEGIDGDGASFRMEFTDQWENVRKRFLKDDEVTPGVGYLLTLYFTMAGETTEYYAYYVFDTEKDLNQRRFPRDYMKAIETIMDEAVKGSVLKVTDEYDFIRSWK